MASQAAAASRHETGYPPHVGLNGIVQRLRTGVLSTLDADERTLLQSRLRLYTLVILLMSASLFLATVAISVAVKSPRNVDPTNVLSLAIHVAMVGGNLAIWAIAGRKALSIRTLHGLDATVVMLSGVGTVLVLCTMPAYWRPDVSLLFGLAMVLLARAALLPSAPARSAVLGLLAVLPMCIGTYFSFRDTPTLPESPPPWAATLWNSVWAMMTVAATVVVSQVIYGLRQRVEAARKLGQYTLEERIGRGGMGVVYRASHALLRRPTVIKLLDPDLVGTQAMARFEREVQTTSQLTHPNTVQIYDFGRTPDGSFYYAMEYL